MWSRQSPEAAFLRLALRGEAPDAVPGLDAAARAVRRWPALAELAATHRVAPWLLRVLLQVEDRSVFPAAFLDSLRATTLSQTIFTLALECALEQALGALEAVGVPAIVLKGPVVAEGFYADPSLRPYTDMDILVPVEDQAKVSAVVEGLGYVLEEDHGGLAAPHAGSNEHAFELLYVQPESQARLDVHLDHLQLGLRPQGLAGLWERSEPRCFGAARARAPSAADHFLVLAVHLHRHGFNRLIWFKDLDLFIRRFGDAVDWDELARTAAAEGVSASLRLCLRRVSRLLGTPLPPAARRLARASLVGLIAAALWPERELFRIEARRDRWRRAVQFVPREGVRGAVPSLLLMGRRGEKLQALLGRALRRWGRSRTTAIERHAGAADQP